MRKKKQIKTEQLPPEAEAAAEEKAGAESAAPTGAEAPAQTEPSAPEAESAAAAGTAAAEKPAEPPEPPAKKSGKKGGKKNGKKKRGSVSTFILIIFFLVGIGVLLYPSVSDWWNTLHTSRAIASYVEAVEDLSAEYREEMLEEAHAYNAKLSPGVHFTLTEEELAEYNSVLDITGTGIMGYVQIPSIDVTLPIYHSTDETVLQVAVGHIPGSSLPVGGEGTHAVISGHRGLPSAKLFTDLDKLVVGDIFVITTLDEVLTYMVDQVRIVLPQETDDLAIVKGQDYCTMITCTPYGVNSHRILVRGRRIANMLEEVPINAEAERISSNIVILALGVPLLFLLLIITLIYTRRKSPKKSHEDLLDELKRS